MARYIAIDKAKEDFFNIRCDGGCECYPDGCDSCLIYEGAEFFIGYETEDVQPVIHGGWVGDEDYEHMYGYYEAYKCSNCGRGVGYRSLYPYCPECGTKMWNGVTEEERMRY